MKSIQITVKYEQDVFFNMIEISHEDSTPYIWNLLKFQAWQGGRKISKELQRLIIC